jgi:hypothetical protein
MPKEAKIYDLLVIGGAATGIFGQPLQNGNARCPRKLLSRIPGSNIMQGGLA